MDFVGSCCGAGSNFSDFAEAVYLCSDRWFILVIYEIFMSAGMARLYVAELRIMLMFEAEKLTEFRRGPYMKCFRCSNRKYSFPVMTNI